MAESAEFVPARVGLWGTYGGVETVEKALSLPHVRGVLDDVQLGAVRMALLNRASVLTGGPGTGKTTVAKAVIAALKECGVDKKEILLAAPTGRAAKRMAEVTGHEAKTIHRMLGYNPGVDIFEYHRNNPLKGKFLVIDEASMIDMPLMASLLEAVPEEMGVLFVGDADQLPPVGPGAPFHEVVRRHLLPSTVLKRIYRQGEGSAIAVNAMRVNGGETPDPIPGDPSYRQKIYARPSRGLSEKGKETARERMRQEIAADAVAEVKRLLNRGYGPDDIQVLTPIKKSSVGSVALNAALRPVLNPEGYKRGVFKHGSLELWVGDRVVHLVNDYDKMVFNGEIGTVIKILDDESGGAFGGHPAVCGLPMVGLKVKYDDGSGSPRFVEYTRSESHEVALAFASTVHKAQGCEFPAVVFVVTWDSYLLLKRNTLYTGISRARSEIAVLAEEGTLERAAATADDAKRHQRLFVA